LNKDFNAVITASDAEQHDLFLGTAARLGTAVQKVEKDFWVCWTLDAGGPRLLFKGAVGVSKVEIAKELGISRASVYVYLNPRDE